VDASDDGQRLTAAWFVSVDGSYRVETSSSTNGGVSWSRPVAVSARGQDAYVPQVVNSDDGSRATVAWRGWNGSQFVLQAASSSNSGTAWSSPVTISAASQSAYSPRLASSDNTTRVLAVWEGYDGIRSQVLASSTGNSGSTWAAPQTLSRSDGAFAPRIAASADGTRATAVWYSQEGGRLVIRAASTRDGGARWTNPAALSAPGEDAFSPDVALSANGESVAVAWVRFDGQSYQVQSSTSTSGGSAWSKPAVVSASAIGLHSPRVVSSEDGATLHAAWESSAGGEYVVQAASSSNRGSGWSTPRDLSEAGQAAGGTELVCSSSGSGALALWIGNEGDAAHVQTASTSDTGASWTPARSVSEPGADAFEAHAAVSADGTRASVVWSSLHGSDYRIETSSSSVKAIPGPPGKPDVTAGNGEVGLSWTPPSDTGDSPITAYRVQQRDGATGAWTTSVDNTGGAGTTRRIDGLLNGSPYQFRVAAINAEGLGTWSAPSAEVRPNGPFTPPPTLPPDPGPEPTVPSVPPGGENPAMPPTPSVVPASPGTETDQAVTRKPGVTAKAVSNRSKVSIRITPARSEGRWLFKVQKERAKRWVYLQRKGKSRTWQTPSAKVLNLGKGRYRVVVPASIGYSKAVSNAVRLKN
jgi:hypothetical protein